MNNSNEAEYANLQRDIERTSMKKDGWLEMMIARGCPGATTLYARSERRGLFGASKQLVEETTGWRVGSYTVEVDNYPYPSTDIKVDFWLTINNRFLIGNVHDENWGGLETSVGLTEEHLSNLRAIAVIQGLDWHP